MRVIQKDDLSATHIVSIDVLQEDSLRNQIESAIDRVLISFSYTRDNLLCFSASMQPHFLVWCSALALHEDIEVVTKTVASANAREEIFGLQDEGSHAMLSHSFFSQIGLIETKHYNRARAEIPEIYKNMKNNAMCDFFLLK